MNKPVKNILLICLTVCFGALLHADDAEASATYARGRELYLAGDYYDAAAEFEKCQFQSGNPAIRANSLIARMSSYRMAGLHYREFTAIEELLERYPEYVNCQDLIKREFEIGKLFRQGYREPAFWVFRWIPYLQDIDRTAEVYSAALKRAPYAPEAPASHMQLAIYYELEGETLKSLAELRAIMEKHPGSPESKYALLALANGLFAMAGKGDGDSRYLNEAVALFQLFCRKYPDAPEIEFAKNALARAKDVQAGKLFEIAEFYRKNGRSEVAGRYLAQVMSNYPDSASAAEAEKTLLAVSQDYLPGVPPEKIDARYPDLKSYPIPENAELLLISPGDKKSPFLLEVPDLKGELPAKLQQGGKK